MANQRAGDVALGLRVAIPAGPSGTGGRSARWATRSLRRLFGDESPARRVLSVLGSIRLRLLRALPRSGPGRRERPGQEAGSCAFGADAARRRRNRLLLKITGWPRIGYLNEMFEDARFIHIMRDGRAVASSLMHVDFWRGWYGPQGWRAGMLSPEDQALWESYDRSFTALAGIEWRIQMRAMEAARKQLDPRLFMEVRHEAFCEQPMKTFRRVLEFAELPASAGARARRAERQDQQHQQPLA